MTDSGALPTSPSRTDGRFAALFSLSPVGMAQLDDAGTIVEANPALGAFLERQELSGTSLFDLAAAGTDAELLRSAFAAQPSARDGRSLINVRLENAEDGPVHTRVTFGQIPGTDEDQPLRIAVFEDVNDLHLLHERLRHQNIHDPLTGLPNATSFHNRLESWMVDRSARTVALIFLDVDGFRVINDGLGAQAGDHILRNVASKIRTAFSHDGAHAARLTGDGFGVLLRGDLTAQTVIAEVERLLADLREPVYVGEDGVGISASAGIVVRPVGEGTADDLVRAAEITLHRAKEAGKSKWMLFEPGLDTQDRQRYRLGAVIAGALENGEFELSYQPSVRLDGSGEVPVVNTVLRWNHPRSGKLDSAEFLPLADTTGMTLPLGEWVIGEAVSALARWRSATGGEAPDVCMRLPARLAVDDDLVRIVRDELTRHDVPAGSLRLCADSSTLLDPRGEVLDSLAVLGDVGVKVVLAVSGVADLDPVQRHQIPVGFVVLTGQIVDALLEPDEAAGSHEGATKHIGHLIEIARELGVRIGAEGVRTAEQARRLADLGVIAARGEFYLDALSADDVQQLIAKQATRAS